MQDDAVMALIRTMRHSFLNHLQVIAGWLQLQRTDRAQEYVALLADRMQAEGEMVRLGSSQLALALLLAAAAADQHGVWLHWQVELPPGAQPDPAACAVLQELLLAAIVALSAAGGQPALRIHVDSGVPLRAQLNASQPLRLAEAELLQAQLAACGGTLSGNGGSSLLLLVPPAPAGA